MKFRVQALLLIALSLVSPAEAGILKRLSAPVRVNIACAELSLQEAKLDTARTISDLQNQKFGKLRSGICRIIEPLVFCEFYCRSAVESNISGVKILLTGRE